MRHDLRVLSLVAGITTLMLAAAAYAADEPTTASKTDATAIGAPTSTKAQGARHQRKVYLNSKRAARQAARKQAAPPETESDVMPDASGPLTDVAVSFKLDPRLTRSLHMGDRWFSPATFTTTQDADRINVEVRAVGRDARGQDARIDPEWIAADPKMVTVTPARGGQVTITVHRAGETRLRVIQPLAPTARSAADGRGGEAAIVKELTIRAWKNQGSAIQAEISQLSSTIGVRPRHGGAKEQSLSVLESERAALAAGQVEGAKVMVGNLQTDAAR